VCQVVYSYIHPYHLLSTSKGVATIEAIEAVVLVIILRFLKGKRLQLAMMVQINISQFAVVVWLKCDIIEADQKPILALS
jgi:hypothetical protein